MGMQLLAKEFLQSDLTTRKKNKKKKERKKTKKPIWFTMEFTRHFNFCYAVDSEYIPSGGIGPCNWHCLWSSGLAIILKVLKNRIVTISSHQLSREINGWKNSEWLVCEWHPAILFHNWSRKMTVLLGLLSFWIWWRLAGSNSALDGDVDGRWGKMEARELADEIVPFTLSKELTGVA